MTNPISHLDVGTARITRVEEMAGPAFRLSTLFGHSNPPKALCVGHILSLGREIRGFPNFSVEFYFLVRLLKMIEIY